VIVFKKKKRKNYRRTQGHRQDFTDVKITAVQSVWPGGRNGAICSWWSSST